MDYNKVTWSIVRTGLAGGALMANRNLESTSRISTRRGWFRATAGGLAAAAVGGLGSAPTRADEDDGAIKLDDADLDEVERRLKEAGIDSVRRMRSNHFDVIGDAGETFMKSCLTDCERLAFDFLRHFKARGFEVDLPEGRLIVVAFDDDRSFGKFFDLPSLMRAGAQGVGAQPSGVYDRSTNLLNVFDWRNAPMFIRSANRNAQTLAHEGTHQLTFNTGLLDRAATPPVCVVEGLGTYGEPRKVMGPSDLGRLNIHRLDDLAKLRRMVDWIPLRELLANDKIFREGLVARLMLAYAQSWVLIHYLLNTEDRIPRFRAYLKVARTGESPELRLKVAEEHLGDLGELDEALKAYSIKLLRSL